MTHPRIEELPLTGKMAVLHLVELLGDGFTGQITFDCSQGGVSNISETRRTDPRKLDVGGK